MKIFKISLVALFIASSVMLIAPQSTHAQGLIVGTRVRFDEPFAIPGKVLPAGDYAFVETNPAVVQIWDGRQQQLLATLITNSAEQPQFEPHHEFEFQDMGSDRPAELKAWFKEGDTLGREFIYQK